MGIDINRLSLAAQKQIAEKMMRSPQSAPQTAPLASRGANGGKYHNQPAMRGSIRFDSQKEARRYDELMLMLKAGEIRELKLQPQFTLQEAYTTPEGNRVRAISMPIVGSGFCTPDDIISTNMAKMKTLCRINFFIHRFNG